jgi:hypothetical protein
VTSRIADRRTVRHQRFREGRELHTLAGKLDDLLDNLVHSAFAAVERGADLHGGGSDGSHGGCPPRVNCSSRLSATSDKASNVNGGSGA